MNYKRFTWTTVSITNCTVFQWFQFRILLDSYISVPDSVWILFGFCWILLDSVGFCWKSYCADITVRCSHLDPWRVYSRRETLLLVHHNSVKLGIVSTCLAEFTSETILTIPDLTELWCASEKNAATDLCVCRREYSLRRESAISRVSEGCFLVAYTDPSR